MSQALLHHFAELDDVTLHYVTAGRGPVVVLLHGWPQTWYEWRHVIPTLAERYTVIAPDLRGLGDSSRPLAGYDKQNVAHDIWQLVNGKLGFERFFLVGHDWGGPTAYALAAAHPDAVARLCHSRRRHSRRRRGFFARRPALASPIPSHTGAA